MGIRRSPSIRLAIARDRHVREADRPCTSANDSGAQLPRHRRDIVDAARRAGAVPCTPLRFPRGECRVRRRAAVMPAHLHRSVGGRDCVDGAKTARGAGDSCRRARRPGDGASVRIRVPRTRRSRARPRSSVSARWSKPWPAAAARECASSTKPRASLVGHAARTLRGRCRVRRQRRLPSSAVGGARATSRSTAWRSARHDRAVRRARMLEFSAGIEGRGRVPVRGGRRGPARAYCRRGQVARASAIQSRHHRFCSTRTLVLPSSR